jgi:hypothetical protein
MKKSKPVAVKRVPEWRNRYAFQQIADVLNAVQEQIEKAIGRGRRRYKKTFSFPVPVAYLCTPTLFCDLFMDNCPDCQDMHIERKDFGYLITGVLDGERPPPKHPAAKLESMGLLKDDDKETEKCHVNLKTTEVVGEGSKKKLTLQRGRPVTCGPFCAVVEKNETSPSRHANGSVAMTNGTNGGSSRKALKAKALNKLTLDERRVLGL